MGRKSKIFAVIVAAIGLTLFTIPRSLRMPPAFIEGNLLKMAPLGSTNDQVLRRLKEKGYRPQLAYTGFYKQKVPGKPEVVGNSSIRVELGQYRTPFVTSVTAFWGFDKTGKLIDVWVWKTVDAF